VGNEEGIMSLFAELILTGRTYLCGGYPPFLYRGQGLEDHLPVFCYHDVGAKRFEGHLRYLLENGYETIDCRQIVERLSVGEISPREVALTFDDGLESVYDAVFPLLKKYHMKAIAYVCPAWIGRPGFVGWEQCREMQESGLVDIQSHSYAHARVPTSLKLVKVWCESDGSPGPWGILGFDRILKDGRIRCLPMMEGASLFSGQFGLVIPDMLWQEWSEVLSECPKADFKRRFDGIVRGHANRVLRMSEAELFRLMVEDLQWSREKAERKIPEHFVEHLAFPWHDNSPLAWKAAEEAGFVSAAIGLRSTDRSQGRNERVTRILRVNEDFLPCLPGRGRYGFLQVLITKMLRRVLRKSVYGILD
jgi:hypothetical protein